jgi:orotate phosphoribosyltransferase
MTGGTSILSTCEQLEEAGMTVRDAIVLIDREQGGIERLHERGCRVMPILRLKTMLNYYHAAEVIDDATYQRSIDYLHERHDALNPPPDDAADSDVAPSED